MAYFKCSSGKGKGGINTKAFLYSIDESQGGVWVNSHIDTTSLSKLIFTYSENSVDKYTAEFNVSDIVVYSGSGADVFTTVFPATISTNAFNVRIYNDELWVSFSGMGDSFKAVSIYKDITQQLMGVTNIISGTDIPANSNGVDGQIYLRYKHGDSDIPNIYIQKEYLEVDSTSGPYIDTGLTTLSDSAKLTTEAEIQFSFTSTPDYNTWLFGSFSGYGIILGYQNNQTEAYVGTGGKVLDYDTNIHTVSFKDNSIYADEVLMQSGNWSQIPNNIPIYIFARGGDVKQIKNTRIYKCKIWQNGSLVRDMIPVQRKSDNELGMYDKVTDTFFDNDGTGSFTASDLGIFQTYLKVNGVWEELLGEDVNNVIPDNALSYLIKEDSTPISGEGTDGQIYLKYGLPQGALLHFEESATADEFGNTWTSTGAVLSTDQAKFGTKSLYFSGSAILESDEGNTNFQFGMNDFTIACWIYPTSTSRQTLFAFNHGGRIGCDLFYGQGSANMWLGSNGSQWNEIQSDTSGSKTGQGTIALTANTWTHIAYTRKGNKCRMFVNGQLARESTITDGTSVYWASNDSFRIGQWDNSMYQFSGYIDDFLILNGICLYDSAFNVPTEPYDKNVFEQYVNGIYVKSQGEWVELMNREVSLVKNAQPSPTVIKNVLKGTSVPPINKGGSGDMYLRYTDMVEGYNIGEYIEVGSTAGPYINTGCHFSADDEYEVKVQYTGAPDQDTYVFGDWVSNKDTMVGYYDSKFVFAVGSSTYRPTFDTNEHIFYATRSQMLMDGVDTGVVPNWNNTATGWIGLFKHNSHSATKNCKLFYAKMWTSGNLSHDFRPAVRESDNTIGVLDIVTGVFYTNDGTGDFTISSTSLEMSNKPVLNPYAKVDGIWRDLVGTDVDSIDIGEEPKNEIGINYLKLKINQTRAVPSDGCLQMDEFKIYQNGHLYNWNEEVSITTDMSAISGYEITKLIDGDIDTKFATLDWGSVQTNTCNIIIDLKETLILDANSTYTFITPNDEPTRDPVTWALYGSVDGVNWNRLDDRNGIDITTARKTETQEFYFNVLNGDVPEFLCDEGYFVETVSKTQGSSSIKIIKQSTDGTKVETTYTQSEAETEITIDDLFKFKFQQGSNWLFTVLKDCDGFKAGDQQGWNYNSDADFFMITKYSWSANCEWLYCGYGNTKYTCTLSGRRYFKVYPHQTLVGYMYATNGYTTPIYVSNYAKAVVHNTSDGGGPFTPISFQYRGRTWYVNTNGYAMSGNQTDSSAYAIKIPSLASTTAGAKYIIDHCGYTEMTTDVDDLPLEKQFVDFDFTQSLTDNISDYEVTLSNCTRTSSGVEFSSSTSAIELNPRLFDFGRKYEFEIGTMSKQFGSDVHGKLFVFTTQYYQDTVHPQTVVCNYGFAFHYQTQRWGVWDYVNKWQDSDITDPDYFANSKVTIIITYTGAWEIYKDGVLIFAPPTPLIHGVNDVIKFSIGTGADAQSFYDLQIKNLKVYDLGEKPLDSEKIITETQQLLVQDGLPNPLYESLTFANTSTQYAFVVFGIDDNVNTNGSLEFNGTSTWYCNQVAWGLVSVPESKVVTGKFPYSDGGAEFLYYGALGMDRLPKDYCVKMSTLTGTSLTIDLNKTYSHVVVFNAFDHGSYNDISVSVNGSSFEYTVLPYKWNKYAYYGIHKINTSTSTINITYTYGASNSRLVVFAYND